jgi:hypothetical protein
MITSDNSSIKVTVFFIHSRIERTNMMNTEKSQLMGRELHYRGFIYIYPHVYIYLSPIKSQVLPLCSMLQWLPSLGLPSPQRFSKK